MRTICLNYWDFKCACPDSSPNRTSKQVLGYLNQLNYQKPYGKTIWTSGNSNGTPPPFVKDLTLISSDGKYTFTYTIPDLSTGMIYYKYKLNEKEKEKKRVPSTSPVKERKPTTSQKPVFKRITPKKEPEPIPVFPYWIICIGVLIPCGN